MLDITSVRRALHSRTIGFELDYRPQVISTQDVVREAAGRGVPEGFVVMADEQTGGRGRLGRSWISPPGVNLYVSVLLRPEPRQLPALAMLAPLAVCCAVEDTVSLRAGIKWPNDVVVNGRKLAGVLIETEFRGDAVSFTIAGMGVNVNLETSRIDEIRGTATSLREELGRPVGREAVLIALLGHLDRLYGDLKSGRSPHAEWKARLLTLGQQVRVRIGEQVEEGTAEDVREDGALMLRRPDGVLVTIEAGEVTLRG